MVQRKTQKAWAIVSKNKVSTEKGRRGLEKEGYRIIGISDLPSGENIMIIGERRITLP